MRSVTISLIAGAIFIGLISAGCQAQAPSLTIPANSPPAGWIELETKSPEPATSIYVPKGWISQDARYQNVGDPGHTILRAEAPRTKPDESVAKLTIHATPNSEGLPTKTFTSGDLAEFVGGWTNGNPRG